MLKAKQRKTLVAVCASDLHLSSRPPIFRSKEQDWIGVQKSYLTQVDVLCQRVGNPSSFLSDPSRVPFLIAGDVTNKYDADPATITLALQGLPEQTYAIPGNHDLPGHRLDAMDQSAYGSLVAAGRVFDIPPGTPALLPGTNIRVWGFPCGSEVVPLQPHDLFVDVALIHAFIWTKDTGYPDAPEEFKLGKWKRRLQGYDIALFGDNHTTVTWNLDRQEEGPAVYNPGTFLIRKSSELGHRPQVGLLFSDGTVEPHYLDTSKDRYLERGEEPTLPIQGGLQEGAFDQFAEELLKLGDEGLDFAALLRRMVDNPEVGAGTRSLVLKILEGLQ